MSCGLMVGGAGGGAFCFRSPAVAEAFFCSTHILMKSAFSASWSSVMPIASNSSSSAGSMSSTLFPLFGAPFELIATSWGGMMECIC